MAALAFDDSGGQWGGKQGMWGRATGTGRSNAYFVASLNGGPPGGQSYIWGGTPPLAPPVEPPLCAADTDLIIVA